ncbi:RING finger protein 11-like isoform X2 [Tachypleus tridentatus]|uniref:RING finger protein 11-like isoform X2 n=1 Tax=Tachypleus tridentatus TaxID=6853 RepID=UPI003FD40A65
MGNCLKSFGSDDVSLLQENNSTSTRESSIDQLEVPPSYQESILAPVYQSTPNVSHPVSQLTEEQIKVAQHIGLIQHLPTGCYDESKKVREKEKNVSSDVDLVHVVKYVTVLWNDKVWNLETEVSASQL